MNRKIYYFQCISKLSHCKSTAFFIAVKKKVDFFYFFLRVRHCEERSNPVASCLDCFVVPPRNDAKRVILIVLSIVCRRLPPRLSTS